MIFYHYYSPRNLNSLIAFIIKILILNITKNGKNTSRECHQNVLIHSANFPFNHSLRVGSLCSKTGGGSEDTGCYRAGGLKCAGSWPVRG